MLKKLILAAAALAVSAPALAGPHGKQVDRRHFDRGHSHAPAYGHRHVVVHRPVRVVHRPVYRPAPVVHHYYHRPAPRPVVVHHYPHANPGALLVGAVLGAAIVHHVVTGY
jgi:hypothetical protein